MARRYQRSVASWREAATGRVDDETLVQWSCPVDCAFMPLHRHATNAGLVRSETPTLTASTTMNLRSLLTIGVIAAAGISPAIAQQQGSPKPSAPVNCWHRARAA